VKKGKKRKGDESRLGRRKSLQIRIFRRGKKGKSKIKGMEGHQEKKEGRWRRKLSSSWKKGEVREKQKEGQNPIHKNESFI